MTRWADAAERIGGSGMSYNEMRRRDPVGGASNSPHHSRQPSIEVKSSGGNHHFEPHNKSYNSDLPPSSQNLSKPNDSTAFQIYESRSRNASNCQDYQNIPPEPNPRPGYGHARARSTDDGSRSQYLPQHERSRSQDSHSEASQSKDEKWVYWVNC